MPSAERNPFPLRVTICEGIIMERDMTKGSPAKIIFSFTVPVFLGNIFQQFYSMVDTIIVGKAVGTPALAAVGATGTITFLILGFLMGMTVGFTVLTAQRFGAGDMAACAKPWGWRRFSPCWCPLL